MVDWAYNDIDVYVSASDNILGETSVNTNSWVPLSTYGLLRSRVALTPSTVEGNSFTIPGRDGKTYSTDSGHGNAKLEFEILIADEWVHRASETTANMTVRARYDMVAALLNNARRIAYKQPGRSANSYFIVYKTTLTFQDADEKAFVIKAQMEVFPFEFYLDGNVPITIKDRTKFPQDRYGFSNPLPFSDCYPTIVVGGGLGKITITPTGMPGYPGGEIQYLSEVPQNTIIDSFLNLAYYSSGNNRTNRNMYFLGDFRKIMVCPGGCNTISIINDTTNNITFYSRRGIRR